MFKIRCEKYPSWENSMLFSSDGNYILNALSFILQKIKYTVFLFIEESVFKVQTTSEHGTSKLLF